MCNRAPQHACTTYTAPSTAASRTRTMTSTTASADTPLPELASASRNKQLSIRQGAPCGYGRTQKLRTRITANACPSNIAVACSAVTVCVVAADAVPVAELVVDDRTFCTAAAMCTFISHHASEGTQTNMAYQQGSHTPCAETPHTSNSQLPRQRQSQKPSTHQRHTLGQVLVIVSCQKNKLHRRGTSMSRRSLGSHPLHKRHA
mgnify:FL=1